MTDLYRIMLQAAPPEWWEGEAENITDACKKAGWPWAICLVKKYREGGPHNGGAWIKVPAQDPGARSGDLATKTGPAADPEKTSLANSTAQAII